VTLRWRLPTPAWDWPDGTFATPEVTPGGVALLDYDNDGRLDILQICHARPGRFTDPAPDRLFHQEPDGTFKEAQGAGLNDPGFGHGVAVGDFDNDGFVDVLITNYGPNHLYRNTGRGTFVDVTQSAGLARPAADPPEWCSSAAFFDYDRDGDLDLYVCTFARFDPSLVCKGDGGRPRDYCGPQKFQGVPDLLYRNNGDGTFTDVTKQAGMDKPNRGWGVVCADLTGDGWPDVYVANDEERQNLWVNQHDGTFKDEAVERSVALGGGGQPEAGMGVAVGDILNDGRLAIFITHISQEKNTLYMDVSPPGDPPGFYADKSGAAGMAAVDLPYTGWGAGYFDCDNDGNLDVAIANGRVGAAAPHPAAQLGPFWNAFAEPNLLFLGDGKGKFTDATSRAGDFTARVESTRGLAFGDIDNDGRVDLVSNTIGNVLRVYRNVAPTNGNHWLLVRALTADGKRDALGARLRVVAGDGSGRSWTRFAQAAYSYCSSNDPRAHFGLGKTDKIQGIEVNWPDGSKENFENSGVDRQVVVRQGAGKPAK
jgi:hypothetical protein